MARRLEEFVRLPNEPDNSPGFGCVLGFLTAIMTAALVLGHFLAQGWLETSMGRLALLPAMALGLGVGFILGATVIKWAIVVWIIWKFFEWVF
jgi:hypothetical protein